MNRCELRGGVHLDASYVTDLCMTGPSTTASSTRTRAPERGGALGFTDDAYRRTPTRRWLPSAPGPLRDHPGADPIEALLDELGIRSAACVAPWLPAPTARAACRDWPHRSCAQPGLASAPCPSRTWSAIASASRSTAADQPRTVRRRPLGRHAGGRPRHRRRRSADGVRGADGCRVLELSRSAIDVALVEVGWVVGWMRPTSSTWEWPRSPTSSTTTRAARPDAGAIGAEKAAS